MQQSVRERGLPVIDVRDDAEIANVRSVHQTRAVFVLVIGILPIILVGGKYRASG
jgi:hypothetical protein